VADYAAYGRCEMRVHRNLGMGVRAEVSRTLRANGPVAQRGAFGGARDDADV